MHLNITVKRYSTGSNRYSKKTIYKRKISQKKANSHFEEYCPMPRPHPPIHDRGQGVLIALKLGKFSVTHVTKVSEFVTTFHKTRHVNVDQQGK